MAEPTIHELERSALDAFENLDEQDRKRLLTVVAAMRAGIEIEPADIQGKSPEELRTFAHALWQQIRLHS